MLFAIAIRVAGRWGIREKFEIEDVYQDICLKISSQCDSIPKNVFESDSAAAAYMRAMAANSAHDSLRRRFKIADPDLFAPMEDHLPKLADPGGHSVEKDIFLRQLEDMLALNPRDKTIFGLYYRQGFSAREIASIPAFHLTEKGVESLVCRMATAARQKVKASRGSAAAAVRRRVFGAGR